MLTIDEARRIAVALVEQRNAASPVRDDGLPAHAHFIDPVPNGETEGFVSFTFWFAKPNFDGMPGAAAVSVNRVTGKPSWVPLR